MSKKLYVGNISFDTTSDDLIKEFFLNYPWMANDVTLDLKSHRHVVHPRYPPEDWKITFAETGQATPTGGRLAKIRNYIKTEEFCLTYGDGVSNVALDQVLAFHRKQKKIATLTAIHPMSTFGVIEVEKGTARSFKEKPRLEGLVNGGFFVFSRRIFDYIDEDSVLEEGPLRKIAGEGQLAVFEHHDFWMCMDTFKDVERLNRMWAEGQRPWAVWR